MKSKYLFYLLVVLFCCVQNQVEAQFIITVDSVEISGVVRVRPQNLMTEYFYWGPSLYIYYSLINESSTDTITLFSSKADVIIVCTYQNKEFQRWCPCFSYQEEMDSVVRLLPLETKNCSCNTFLFPINFFYERKLNRDTIVDCSREVIETLPTLRIHYSDRVNEAVSSGITKVTIGTYTVYYKPPKFDE